MAKTHTDGLKLQPDAVKLLAQHILLTGYDNLPPRERRVIERVARRLSISRDFNNEYESRLTFGERMADRIAAFGGSWTFIIAFAAGVTAWVGLNTLVLVRLHAEFDPYPFILLNLILSMVAAIQAPVIMMSQNRLASRDRMQASQDYEVTLKSELEILALHDKLDEIRNRDLAELTRAIRAMQPVQAERDQEAAAWSEV